MRGIAILSSLFVFALLAPSCVYAQSSGDVSRETAEIFGSGDQPNIAPALIQPNFFLLDASYETSYDSNPLGLHDGAQGDMMQDASAHMVLLHSTQQVHARIEYLPYYQVFQKNSEWDVVNQPVSTFNQYLSADVDMTFTERWSARVRDDFTKEMGSYLPQVGENANSGIGAPSNLNSTIYLPFEGEQGNTSRVDVLYQWSQRTSLDVFGGHDLRTFSNQVPGTYLSDTYGNSFGGQYAWRSSEHTTLGAIYVFQRTHVSGNLLPGSASSMDVSSVLPSAGWRPRPSLDFEVFGGPQFVKLGGAGLGAALDHLTEWAGGGTAIFQLQNTAFFINGQRVVSDGGGLLPFVTSSVVSVGGRRRFGQWNAAFNISAARNNWIAPAANAYDLTAYTGSLRLTHRLSRDFTFTSNYEYIHQGSSGSLPVGGDFQRNRITAGITWQLRAIPLG